MTADVLGLTLEELEDEKFKEKLNEQMKEEEYIWDKADTLSQIEDIKHISNRIMDVMEHKDKEWQKSVRNKLDDIRALCDSVEKRIGDE